MDGPKVEFGTASAEHVKLRPWADIHATECAESKECHPAKHHYDECVERVTGQIENDGKASEDCVEECTSYSGPMLK